MMEPREQTEPPFFVWAYLAFTLYALLAVVSETIVGYGKGTLDFAGYEGGLLGIAVMFIPIAVITASGLSLWTMRRWAIAVMSLNLLMAIWTMTTPDAWLDSRNVTFLLISIVYFIYSLLLLRAGRLS